MAANGQTWVKFCDDDTHNYIWWSIDKGIVQKLTISQMRNNLRTTIKPRC